MCPTLSLGNRVVHIIHWRNIGRIGPGPQQCSFFSFCHSMHLAFHSFLNLSFWPYQAMPLIDTWPKTVGVAHHGVDFLLALTSCKATILIKMILFPKRVISEFIFLSRNWLPRNIFSSWLLSLIFVKKITVGKLIQLWHHLTIAWSTLIGNYQLYKCKFSRYKYLVRCYKKEA